jgi:hypothetical protein
MQISFLTQKFEKVDYSFHQIVELEVMKIKNAFMKGKTPHTLAKDQKESSQTMGVLYGLDYQNLERCFHQLSKRQRIVATLVS